MRTSRFLYYILLFALIVILPLTFFTACTKSETNQEVENKIGFNEASEAVKQINIIGGIYGDNTGLCIEEQDEGFRIYFGDEFEKILESLCENYNKYNEFSGSVETITSEQFESAFVDNPEQTINEFISNDSRFDYLYNFLKWCGTSCRESAVFCGGSEYEKDEWERKISNGYYENVSVVANQIYYRETNRTFPIKFKWQ